jgi:hypothetical protein
MQIRKFYLSTCSGDEDSDYSNEDPKESSTSVSNQVQANDTNNNIDCNFTSTHYFRKR